MIGFLICLAFYELGLIFWLFVENKKLIKLLVETGELVGRAISFMERIFCNS